MCSSKPGAKSRWTRNKDLSWNAIKLGLCCEVSYDHMQGARFRHASHFKRWRPDKQPADCRYDQLEVTPPYEVAMIDSNIRTGTRQASSRHRSNTAASQSPYGVPWPAPAPGGGVS